MPYNKKIAELRALIEDGTLSPEVANLRLVEYCNVYICNGKIPKETRWLLDNYVRLNLLCHKAKCKLLPEVYYTRGYGELANKVRETYSNGFCHSEQTFWF